MVMDKLTWHYGPTETDKDCGKMWCDSCGSEVWGFKEGFICSGCDLQVDVVECDCGQCWECEEGS